jgi:homoserine kinase
LADAVFNAGRVGLLLRALAGGEYAKLPAAMQDRLHQPYRLPLVPGQAHAVDAARQAGAASAALSGAGPSVIAFAPSRHEEIAAAMQAAFGRAGLASRAWTLGVDRRGASVTSAG